MRRRQILRLNRAEAAQNAINYKTAIIAAIPTEECFDDITTDCGLDKNASQHLETAKANLPKKHKRSGRK